jgi:glycosyltransferase involved in cell wall biosynthesis
MRILWLTPELPYWPGGSGGSTRQYMLIRELIARGHSVDVVAPIQHEQDPDSLRATGATLYATARPPSRIREVAGALRNRPGLLVDALRMPVLAWQVEVFWTELRERMRDAVNTNFPDVIVVEHDWAARWHDDLPAGVPTVLGLENLSSHYYARRGMRIEARRFGRFDRAQLPKFDALLTMSDDDGAHLDGPTETIPNGVDTMALTATPLPGAPVALFTGTFGYPPNAQALDWLLAEIWPRVRAEIADARLLVVGRGGRGEGDGVEVAGWVPEMQPWFDRARAVLVPIRSGAGTRLKVLDGLASGRALVTTTIGAEGVKLAANEHALVADTAEQFAAAVVRALDEPGLAERLGETPAGAAEDVYDWRVIAARLEAVLAGLASARS